LKDVTPYVAQKYDVIDKFKGFVEISAQEDYNLAEIVKILVEI